MLFAQHQGVVSASRLRHLAGLLACLALSASIAWAQPVGPAWGGLAYEVYQVRDGDTVQNVAARFGVSPELIANFNALDSWVLSPGQDLAIPLPGAATADRAEGASEKVIRNLPPRYAVVSSSGQIRSKPEGGTVLWEPTVGTRLVVRADEGSHWGVVMVDGSTGWIPRSCLNVTDQVIAPDRLEAMLRGGRPDIVAAALGYMGAPYRYGGSSASGMDCSGLVQAACAAQGIRLPRTASAQFDIGRPVNANELVQGDRLYFVDRSGRINHTGIYMDNLRFVHASSRRGYVAVDSLTDPFYWSRFVGARRF